MSEIINFTIISVPLDLAQVATASVLTLRVTIRATLVVAMSVLSAPSLPTKTDYFVLESTSTRLPIVAVAV